MVLVLVRVMVVLVPVMVVVVLVVVAVAAVVTAATGLPVVTNWLVTESFMFMNMRTAVSD